jgi:two-component sensor histidine kinase
MSVIQAIVRQMMKTSVRWQDFQTKLDSRLLALATSHDVLILQDWKGAPLRELIREQLVPFYDVANESVATEGPEVRVTVEAAQTIGLAIHELASNAVRFGALSIPSGKVDLNWRLETDDGGRKTLSLCWRERNGPPVVEPTRRGFGYVVLHDIVSKSLNASVTMTFAMQGLEWVATIPADSQLIAR